jgi:hypothetical protein
MRTIDGMDDPWFTCLVCGRTFRTRRIHRSAESGYMHRPCSEKWLPTGTNPKLRKLIRESVQVA